jgi:hypothetical protein
MSDLSRLSRMTEGNRDMNGANREATGSKDVIASPPPADEAIRDSLFSLYVIPVHLVKQHYPKTISGS